MRVDKLKKTRGENMIFSSSGVKLITVGGRPTVVGRFFKNALILIQAGLVFGKMWSHLFCL